MNKSFLTLLKTKRLGRYCKAGAWSILSLSIVYAIVYTFYAWNIYNEMKNSNNVGNSSTFNYFYVLLPLIAAVCQGAIFTIFGFLVLYIAGTIFTTLAASLAPTPDETEDIVYESIDEPIKTQN